MIFGPKFSGIRRFSALVRALVYAFTHVREYEPPEKDVLVDHLLEVGHLVGGRPVQEDVERHRRPLVLDLVDQRRQPHRVVHLRVPSDKLGRAVGFVDWFMQVV